MSNHRFEKEGSLFTAAQASDFYSIGTGYTVVSTYHDITEQKGAEEQRATELEAMSRLHKIGELFIRDGDIAPILTEIVDAAIAITGADFGNIQLLDAPSSRLRIAAHRGFPKWWIDFWDNVPPGQGACGTALKSGERVIVEDVEQSPIFAGTPTLDIQLKAGVRAVQSTPLVSRSGRPLGMFSTHFKRPHRPHDHTLELLDLLARHAADIIDRAEAENRLKADLTALTRMRALGTRVMETGGLEPLLQEIMDAAVAIAGADKGTLQLVEGDSLRILAHHGHDRSFLDFFTSAENVASVCGEATRRGERVVVEDVEASPLFAGTPSLPVLRDAGVRAVQSTPLICRKGKLLGILTTQWGVPHVPDEDDLWRIDLLARQASDMIEHARAEEEMAHIASFPKLNPSPIMEVDLAGNICYLNSAGETLLNPGTPLSSNPWAADFESLVDTFEKNPNPISREIQIGGSWYQQVVHYVEDIRRIRFYWVDVTERKRMEEELRKSRDELELRVQERTETLRRQAGLLELAHNAIIVRDLEGRITFWNHGAEEMYGWTSDEARGEITHRLLRTKFPVSLYDAMTTLMHAGKWGGELEHTTKDGRILTVLSRWALQRDEAGDPVAIMEINLDVTEARRAEQQLRHAQKVEALGTLSGGIAHDFNNILAAIIGFTELAEDHVAEGSHGARCLKRIMESSLRGRDLVRQMLTFSRKSEQEKKPLSLSSIVKETVKLIRATTPTTITITVDAPSESGMILADPTQMQQVILNLCTNAAHAMREKGGTLDIKLDSHIVSPSEGDPHGISPGHYTRLTVRDTGVGMSPQIVDKIFDPFFTTKKLGEGTGLGLSVVHGIVKQHSGHIVVQSERRRGSTFTLYFPQIAGTGEREADRIRDDMLPTGSGRILLVDDEEALVETGKDILARLGYEVTSMTSGREALALVKEDPSRFDLVITDQTMPEITGVELAKEILALRADMPIILCTGFSHLVDARKAKAAGIKAFAMKPLTRREIAKTVRKLLDG